MDRTHGFYVAKHGDIYVDDVQEGDVPVLQQRQDHHDGATSGYRTAMNNAKTLEKLCEQIWVLVRGGMDSLHDFFPDQAYFICAAVRT